MISGRYSDITTLWDTPKERFIPYQVFSTNKMIEASTHPSVDDLSQVMDYKVLFTIVFLLII